MDHEVCCLGCFLNVKFVASYHHRFPLGEMWWQGAFAHGPRGTSPPSAVTPSRGVHGGAKCEGGEN